MLGSRYSATSAALPGRQALQDGGAVVGGDVLDPVGDVLVRALQRLLRHLALVRRRWLDRRRGLERADGGPVSLIAGFVERMDAVVSH